MPFFTLHGFRECSDFVTSVAQTINSVKTTGIGKLSEIPKTYFAVGNFLAYHGAVVFSVQGSICNLYGNSPSVRRTSST